MPRGTPSPPPCSGSTTRTDCTGGDLGGTCDPASWMEEALDRLESPLRVACGESSLHLVRLAGEHASAAELVDFKARLTSALSAMSGVRAIGVGSCCPDDPDARCLSVYVDPCGTPIDAIVFEVARRRQQDSTMAAREVGMRFELTHPGPRCQKGDATCLPISVDRAADPNLDRYPISYPGGECSTDGECTIGGCLQGCVSWQRAAREWTCPASEEPSGPPNTPRACGCVATQCRWFEQDLPESAPAVEPAH